MKVNKITGGTPVFTLSSARTHPQPIDFFQQPRLAHVQIDHRKNACVQIMKLLVSTVLREGFAENQIAASVYDLLAMTMR